MTDTNRDGISTLHHHSDTAVNLGSNSGWHDPSNEPAVQKRTRSQHDVSDLILHLPLSRSPLKNARKAHVKAQRTLPISQVDSQLPGMVRGAMAGMSRTKEAGTMKAAHPVEDKEMDDCSGGRAQRYWQEEGSQDSLFSLPGSGGGARDEDTKTGPTATGKRVSPDTGTATRALSSHSGERQPKRAKVEGLERFRFPGYTQDHLEYHEPLRDPNTRTPRGHRRASSTRQTPSPSKAVSSTFLRAQSVPLRGENEVPAIDFTAIPPSPRRSPSKVTVEIRRALSVPPPDDEKMDVDAADNSALLHFTNPTQFTTPRAHPMFHCTVNFATPRGPATPRSGSPSATPLSPLTPIPSPLTECLPMQLFSARANVKLLALRHSIPTASPISDVLMAGATFSVDTSQSDARIPSRAPSATTMSRPGSVDALQPPLGCPFASSNSAEPLPLYAVVEEGSSVRAPPMPEDSSQAKDMSSNNAGGAGELFTDDSELSSVPSSPPNSNAIPISRHPAIGVLPRKRGSFIPQGPRRVTRSVSMKAERVMGGPPEIKDSLTTCDMDKASAMFEPPSSSAEISKPRPPKSTSTMTAKPKLPPPSRRSISMSKPLPDIGKLKQTSLNVFMKAKPATEAGHSTIRVSTSNGSSSRLVPPSSPSKIPLPASPLKRPSMAQSGSAKSLPFSLGSTSSGTGTGTPRTTSGRSLTTLSHALDKLVVPPPSRPNTSMGFVRGDGQSDKVEAVENNEGKGKAKDDAYVPTARGLATTFARPTASSLNRTATVMGIGSTPMPKMRGGPAIRETGRGRGMIGNFGRVGDRASKKTSLPVVMGSPVKGSGGTDKLDKDGLGIGKHKLASIFGGGDNIGGAASNDAFMLPSAVVGDKPEQDTTVRAASAEAAMNGVESAVTRKLSPPSLASASDVVDIDLITPISIDKGKQRALPSSTLNPASSALHALSESLSSLPQTPTPPKPKVVGTRSGLRSSTAGTGKESPVPNGSGSGGPSANNEVQSGAGPSSGTVNSSDGAKKSSLKILKSCIIFVDVRTEQGDDAGSLFVDMLKGLGAKIISRLSRKCTHIVYKNGLPTTLSRYRSLDDPKPIVVGIAWVVECVEKRARVDEERFKIDVDMVNVAGGTHKLRRSMLPKHLIPSSPGPVSEMSMHMSSEADDDDGGGGVDGSLSQDLDASIRSREEDDLPPLERARRRRSILPGGQTRLIP